MQKAYNIFSVIAIAGLAGWIYLLSKKTNILEETIVKLTPPPAPPASERKLVSGGEFWDTLQNKMKEVKIDLTFANGQQQL